EGVTATSLTNSQPSCNARARKERRPSGGRKPVRGKTFRSADEVEQRQQHEPEDVAQAHHEQPVDALWPLEAPASPLQQRKDQRGMRRRGPREGAEVRQARNGEKAG